MKQAVCAYVASQAFAMLKRGIRINAICPGPTDTPLAQANKDCGSRSAPTSARKRGSRRRRRRSRPTRCSSCAATPPSGINGITLITDAGYMSSGITGSFPNATMMAKVLMGRT